MINYEWVNNLEEYWKPEDTLRMLLGNADDIPAVNNRSKGFHQPDSLSVYIIIMLRRVA